MHQIVFKQLQSNLLDAFSYLYTTLLDVHNALTFLLTCFLAYLLIYLLSSFIDI